MYIFFGIVKPGRNLVLEVMGNIISCVNNCSLVIRNKNTE